MIEVRALVMRDMEAVSAMERRAGVIVEPLGLAELWRRARIHALAATIDDELAGFLTYKRSRLMYTLVWTRVDDRVQRMGVFSELVRNLQRLALDRYVCCAVPETDTIAQIALRANGFICQRILHEVYASDGRQLQGQLYLFEWSKYQLYPAARNRIAKYFRAPAARLGGDV